MESPCDRGERSPPCDRGERGERGERALEQGLVRPLPGDRALRLPCDRVLDGLGLLALAGDLPSAASAAGCLASSADTNGAPATAVAAVVVVVVSLASGGSTMTL
mmetsp:Transcript_59868/g.155719  ORF Transcript_59868/g.155719 Transcript_59868/m.155719 type:complete len:105 (+) Transcript_59868:716-1030(+)